MPRSNLAARSIVFALAFLPSANLLASALPPNIMASRSGNGRFLVVTERDLNKPDSQGGGQRIIRTSFEVLGLETFINTKDRLSAPVPFWSEAWKVTLQGDEAGRVFWPMISDDGESLALVGVTAPWPGSAVLKIFRRHDSEGILVRSYQIMDLWTPGEVDPRGDHRFVVTDATPQWFSGGRLSFASDSLHFEYRTQWYETLSISLEDGSIVRSTTTH